jgi:hypothetical protein
MAGTGPERTKEDGRYREGGREARQDVWSDTRCWSIETVPLPFVVLPSPLVEEEPGGGSAERLTRFPALLDKVNQMEHTSASADSVLKL